MFINISLRQFDLKRSQHNTGWWRCSRTPSATSSRSTMGSSASTTYDHQKLIWRMFIFYFTKINRIKTIITTVNAKTVRNMEFFQRKCHVPGSLYFKGSVHEKSSRDMWPSTFPYRKGKIRKKVGPETLNSRKLRFIARTVNLIVGATKCKHRLHFLHFYRFRCFTWCQPIMVNRLNNMHWLATPSGARIRHNDWFVDRSSNISTDKTEEQ